MAHGSPVVVLRPGYSTVGRILVPQPGIKPVSPALQGRFLTSGPPGKSLKLTLGSINTVSF